MLWRIVGKLLLKATVPLLLVLGVLSYGHYLRGGDPGALWKGVADSGASRFLGALNGTLDGAKRGAGAAVSSMRSDSVVETAEKSEVFTWQDADGVTHFSQTAPVGVTTRTVIVDPSVNVLAPVRQTESETASVRDTSGYVRDADTGSDDLREIGGMPGIAGQLPNLGGASPGGAELDNSTAAQQQLMKLIQQTEH